MPSRKREKLDITAFRVGSSYTRAQSAELGRVLPLEHTREWTGIVEFDNCVVLFPTLDKSDLPPEHRYEDKFLGKQFKWDSQNRNTQNSPVMVRILSRGTPILLFCRLRPKEFGRPVPFVYVGQVQEQSHAGQNPVKVMFNLLEYQETPGNDLAKLYDWAQKPEA